MDSKVLALTTAIHDVISKQNEDISLGQQRIIESQKQLIDGLESRIAQLETKCQDLQEDNLKTKAELQLHSDTLRDEGGKVGLLETRCMKLVKANEKLNEELSSKVNQKDFDQLRAELKDELNGANKPLLDKFNEFQKHVKLEEIVKWVELTKNLATQVMSLLDSRQRDEKRIINLAKHIKSQELELSKLTSGTTTASSPFGRPPVKSPSVSSFLNSNNHNSMPRSRFTTGIPTTSTINNHRTTTHYFDNSDQHIDIDLSELSDHAEYLKQNLDALNDLQRSFERSTSICSDD